MISIKVSTRSRFINSRIQQAASDLTITEVERKRLSSTSGHVNMRKSETMEELRQESRKYYYEKRYTVYQKILNIYTRTL